MKHKPLNAVALVLYLIGFIAVVCLIIPVFTKTSHTHSEKFITGVLVFLINFTASKILCIFYKEKAKKIMKITVVYLFCVYTFIVIDYTLISDSFGRNISNIFFADKTTVNEYFSQKVNLVPFATVKLFINAYRDANLQTYVIIENILGNIFVLMPFALFIPFLFKKIDNGWRFFVVMLAFVLVIECLQIGFLTGSADIDDFILNTIGAMLAYFVFKIPKINSFINNFIFGELNENIC